MSDYGHTWNYYSTTMVKCPWCGQVRQSLDGKRYWVVTLGANEAPKTYADVLAAREPTQPDPEKCVDRRVALDAPLTA